MMQTRSALKATFESTVQGLEASLEQARARCVPPAHAWRSRRLADPPRSERAAQEAQSHHVAEVTRQQRALQARLDEQERLVREIDERHMAGTRRGAGSVTPVT